MSMENFVPESEEDVTALTDDNLNPMTGSEVYDSDGVALGLVNSVTDTVIHIHKGLIFTQDLYVPPSVVTSVTTDKVYLSVPKAQIEREDWFRTSASTKLTPGETYPSTGGAPDSGPTVSEQQEAASRKNIHDENYNDPYDQS